jgi:DNA polymerase III epsilon subunit-like protein
MNICNNILISDMHVIFDLETTGLLPKVKSCGGRSRIASFKSTNSYKNTRIVSIAWIVLNKKLEEMERHYYVIKPSIKIPDEAIRIHGISNEHAKSHGVELLEVLQTLEKNFNECENIVAHNFLFDKMVLLSELYRHKAMTCIDSMFRLRHYCTMINGQKCMKTGKFPKLSALYEHLFDEELTNAHNALDDTIHCCRCYKVLISQA